MFWVGKLGLSEGRILTQVWLTQWYVHKLALWKNEKP